MVLALAGMAMAAGPALKALGSVASFLPTAAKGMESLGKGADKALTALFDKGGLAATAAVGLTDALGDLAALGGPFAATVGAMALATAALSAEEQRKYELFRQGSEQDQERRSQYEQLAQASTALAASQRQLADSAAEQAGASYGQLDYLQMRLERLNQITDASGAVAEADRAEAQVIIGELNAAFGTEMELREGVIGGIERTAEAIRALLEQKRAETLLESYYESYTGAVEGQSAAYENAARAAEGYGAALDGQRKAQDALRAAEEWMLQDPTAASETWKMASAAAEGANEEFANVSAALTESAGSMAAMRAEVEAYNSAVDAASGGDFEAARKALEDVDAKMSAARRSAEANVGPMISLMEDFGVYARGAVEETGTGLEELAVQLAAAGVAAEEMGGVSGAAFAAMWEACEGSVEQMAAKIGEWNALRAEGKEPTVDASGNVVDGSAAESVRRFNEEAGKAGDSERAVDAEGNVIDGEAKERVDDLKQSEDSLEDKSVDVGAEVYGTESVRALNDEIVNLQSKEVTVTARVNRVEGGSASGGISPGALREVPRHAGGGMTGIVTAPTLTNYGWVGEDGAEAIVPLTNKRYVRPFALAVAREVAAAMRFSDLVENDPKLRGARFDAPSAYQSAYQSAAFLFPGGAPRPPAQSGSVTYVTENHRHISVGGVELRNGGAAARSLSQFIDDLEFEMGM